MEAFVTVQTAEFAKTGPAGGSAARYRRVRSFTERLCEPLVTEDYVVQSMSDVSPTKWHLAHTSWFFETFILGPHLAGYRPFDPHFQYLFNSYYVTVGDRHCRQNRGLLSRPTVEEVYAYRRHVDVHMVRWLDGLDAQEEQAHRPLIEIGLNHEQQHQELMLTDIKHVFWVNPMRPAYHKRWPEIKAAAPMRWIGFAGGVCEIGHEGSGFAFDNESPRHKTYVQPFELASRLVTNGEYKQFIADGGYANTPLWLSLGWATARQEQWQAPLYWICQDGQWFHHTMSGLRPVEDSEPVCHVSYFEADAFARWAGARLADEAEWESAAETVEIDGVCFDRGSRGEACLARMPHESKFAGGSKGDAGDAGVAPTRAPETERIDGNFADAEVYHPAPAAAESAGLTQMFGDTWEWTRSAYLPYPGYQPPAGALGEYNGKFMCNQFVLRGGSCATPRSHIRRTYRNFFPPEARWQFSGIRLARDA